MTLSEAMFQVVIWFSILASAFLMLYILGRFFVELKRNDLW